MAKKAMQYKNVFEGKNLDELYELQSELTQYINQEKDRLEAEKEQEIRDNLSIGDTVYVIQGKGAEAVPVKGRVIMMTETGCSVQTEDGNKVNRRYKKLLNEEQAKQRRK